MSEELSPAIQKAIKRFHQKLAGVRCGVNAPRELDMITDAILSYRPKPKTKAQKKRKRKEKKVKNG